MPIYDYVCHHCGHRFEVIHGIHAEGPKTCPVCHSSEVRKGFVAPTIVFKGSGWAKKDRSASARSSASSKTASSDGSTSGDGDAKASTGTDDGKAAPASKSTSDHAAAPSSAGATSATGAKSASGGAGSGESS